MKFAALTYRAAAVSLLTLFLLCVPAHTLASVDIFDAHSHGAAAAGACAEFVADAYQHFRAMTDVVLQTVSLLLLACAALFVWFGYRVILISEYGICVRLRGVHHVASQRFRAWLALHISSPPALLFA